MKHDIGERRSDKNCLYPHNSKETMKHWLIKAMIFKMLHDNNRTVRTETEIKETKGCVIDVLDEDNLIAYEIESNPTEEKMKRRIRQLWRMHDVFFIDCNKVPNSLSSTVKYLKGKIV